MAVLVYYRVQSGPHVNEVFQAVLIAHESAGTRGKKTENKLWKRVVPSETEFAWLPPDIASVSPFFAFHLVPWVLSLGVFGGCFGGVVFVLFKVSTVQETK